MSVADYMTIAGLGLLAVGCGLAWLPLGLIAAGVSLLLLGLGWERPQK